MVHLTNKMAKLLNLIGFHHLYQRHDMARGRPSLFYAEDMKQHDGAQSVYYDVAIELPAWLQTVCTNLLNQILYSVLKQECKLLSRWWRR